MAGWEEMCCLFLETWQEGFQLILFPLLACLCFHEQLQCGEEMNPSWGRDELLLKGSSEALNCQALCWCHTGRVIVPSVSQQDALSGIISVFSLALSVLPRSQAGPAPALGTLELFLPPCCRGFSPSLPLLHKALSSTPRSSAADPGSVVPSVWSHPRAPSSG